MKTNIDRLILFNNDSNSIESVSFTVPKGSSLLVTGYGLPALHTNPGSRPKNTPFEIALVRCAYEDGTIPGLDDHCNPEINPTVGVSLFNEVVLCCNFTLSACNTEMLITMPGTYRLQMNDTAQVGNVFVFGHFIKNADLPPYVPYSLLGGY